jgi:putative flippase GtrA
MFFNSILRDMHHLNFHSILIFCLIGTCNALLSFLLFTLFWHFFQINYLVATSLTFFIAACVQFFGNRSMTFKDSQGNLRMQMIKYLIMLVINYLVTISVMRFSVLVLDFSPYIAMIVTTACSAIVSFILFKFWIFRHPILI